MNYRKLLDLIKSFFKAYKGYFIVNRLVKKNNLTSKDKIIFCVDKKDEVIYLAAALLPQYKTKMQIKKCLMLVVGKEHYKIASEFCKNDINCKMITNAVAKNILLYKKLIPSDDCVVIASPSCCKASTVENIDINLEDIFKTCIYEIA